jgi:hypothetical protein
MNKIFPVLALIFILNPSLFGQTKEIEGKPVAEIFTDFHINFNDTLEKTGFALNRAYLGYQYLPEGNFSGKIVITIGTPEDLVSGSEPRRYAYFREASLTWSDKNIIVTMGITGTRIFEFQQRFWGKRYIAKPYQSINGYGYVADLGIAVDYVINDLIKTDLTVMNGEGYSNIQLDNNVRTSLGVTITPGEKFAFRLYGDFQRVEGLWQPVFIGFAGFRNELLYIGSEVSYKSNIDLTEGHHAWGISATGGINLNKKTELFGRFDFVSSVIVPNEILKWNYQSDGNFVIAGIQYSLSQDVKIAINYQGRYPYDPAGFISDLVYLNALFKF